MFELLGVTFESSPSPWKHPFISSCLHRDLWKRHLCRVKASSSLDGAIPGADPACWLDSSSFGWIQMKPARCGTAQREALRRGSWTLAKARALLPFIHTLCLSPSLAISAARFTCGTSLVSVELAQWRLHRVMERWLFSSCSTYCSQPPRQCFLTLISAG